MFPHKHLILVSGIALAYLCMHIFAVTRLPQDEVEVLNQIVKTMGANWTFGSDACEDYVDIKPVLLMDPRRNITCDCAFENNTCHIIALKILLFSLPGILPTELVHLPYLQEIDFAYNYLSGPIPSKWAFLQLTYISLFGNRLSGNIPSFLGNITGLKYLDLGVNQFSGSVPSELGKLVHLETLRLSSNRLSGNLPMELAELKNLTDFRINDNNFNGSIPEYIKNWKQLRRLEILGSGLDGPIPPSISGLENVIQLKISDIAGTGQTFPELRNMSNIRRIILKNCSISGEVPEYIWGLNNLRLLILQCITSEGVSNKLISKSQKTDVSFNKLTGELPYDHIYGLFKFIFLSSNFLSGNIPKSILKKGSNVDLSYNNFSWESVEQSACLEKPNLNLNLFRSSSVEKNISGALPCVDNFKCQRYRHSLYINCGGETVKINGKTFEGDAGIGGGAATFYFNANTYWGFSSTGDFMDDDDEQNSNYIANLQSSQISELYTNARIGPTLSYIGYCLENGSYTVRLHFAEIQFTNDKTYRSLGRRKFNIYVKDKLVEKDFDIEAAASGVLKPVIKEYKANVTNNILEIRFIWGGKGTVAIPKAGVYGPLISAISVDPNFKPHYGEEKREILPIVISVGVVGFFTIFLAFCILCWRYFGTKSGRERDFKGLDDLHTSYFTLKQIKTATNNFDSANKIGEGGFGPVYKGQLLDGTTIAVKQLSSKSKQGNREFLNELSMILCLQHPHLVKLYGYCIEGDQLLLIYEYMENNNLAHALFGCEKCQLKLDWPTRQKICLGVAKGLAYLHEESRFKIVHRDIKTTNVLLDRDLNPKISDFGLAKLYEEEKTHISTRIAGTIGYMAPEYALWGYLTYKADVYSFGVVALEIVSGKKNLNYVPESNCSCPLDWAFNLQHRGKLRELVDENLGSDFDKVEAERMINVALVCTNASPSLRPTMSEVVSMLEGTFAIPDAVLVAGSRSEDSSKTPKDHHTYEKNKADFLVSARPWPASSSDIQEVCEVNEESYLMFKAVRDNHIQKSKAQTSTSCPSWIASSSKSSHD